MSNPSPIKFDPSKNGYYRDDDSKSKPTGSSGSKDFSRIMSKNEEGGHTGSGRKQIKKDEDEEQGDDIGVLDEEAEANAPISLFDISKAQAGKPRNPITKANTGKAAEDLAKSGGALTAAATSQKLGEAEESVDLGKDVPLEPEHIGSAEQQQKKAESSKPARPYDLIASTSHEASRVPSKEVGEKSKTTHSPFSREQPDLAAVNPLAGAQPTINVSASTQAERPLPPVKSVQELINAMVKEMQSIEAEGKTDTTITLKYPPVFEGAQLVVSSYGSARGEFNISFENLTQAAQQLISLEANKANLLLALEQKGYHVHILTATTVDEHRIYTANVDDTRDGRDQRDNEQEQGKGSHNEEEA